MLTDRDIILRVLGRKQDPKVMKVGETMTRDVTYCWTSKIFKKPRCSWSRGVSADWWS